MIRGIVRAIDRAAGTVTADLMTGAQITAAYGGHPPPPLSFCLFDQDGPSWYMDAPLADSRVVLHDDFTIVEAVLGNGDTPWRTVDPAGGGLIGTGSMDAAGNVRIRSSATSGQETWLTKTNENITIPEETALWFSARFQLNQATSVRYRIGLADDSAASDPTPGIAGGGAAYLSADTGRSANFELITDLNTAVGSSLLPTPIDTSAHHVDLVITPRGFAALWLDGDGPFVLADDGSSLLIPGGSGSPFQPFLYVEPLSAAQRVMLVDWVHIEEFTDPQHPTLPAIPELELL